MEENNQENLCKEQIEESNPSPTKKSPINHPIAKSVMGDADKESIRHGPRTVMGKIDYNESKSLSQKSEKDNEVQPEQKQKEQESEQRDNEVQPEPKQKEQESEKKDNEVIKIQREEEYSEALDELDSIALTNQKRFEIQSVYHGGHRIANSSLNRTYANAHHGPMIPIPRSQDKSFITKKQEDSHLLNNQQIDPVTTKNDEVESPRKNNENEVGMSIINFKERLLEDIGVLNGQNDLSAINNGDEIEGGVDDGSDSSFILLPEMLEAEVIEEGSSIVIIHPSDDISKVFDESTTLLQLITSNNIPRLQRACDEIMMTWKEAVRSQYNIDNANTKNRAFLTLLFNSEKQKLALMTKKPELLRNEKRNKHIPDREYISTIAESYSVSASHTLDQVNFLTNILTQMNNLIKLLDKNSNSNSLYYKQLKDLDKKQNTAVSKLNSNLEKAIRSSMKAKAEFEKAKQRSLKSASIQTSMQYFRYIKKCEYLGKTCLNNLEAYRSLLKAKLVEDGDCMKQFFDRFTTYLEHSFIPTSSLIEARNKILGMNSQDLAQNAFPELNVPTLKAIFEFAFPSSFAAFKMNAFLRNVDYLNVRKMIRIVLSLDDILYIYLVNSHRDFPIDNPIFKGKSKNISIKFEEEARTIKLKGEGMFLRKEVVLSLAEEEQDSFNKLREFLYR